MDYEDVAPIIEATTRGDSEQAIRLTSPEIWEALSSAATAEAVPTTRRSIA